MAVSKILNAWSLIRYITILDQKDNFKNIVQICNGKQKQASQFEKYEAFFQFYNAVEHF